MLRITRAMRLWLTRSPFSRSFFQFVADHQRRYGVKRLCTILGIARSSFYYLAPDCCGPGRPAGSRRQAGRPDTGRAPGIGRHLPWLPDIGGKRIPPLAAIVPATLGGLALIALWDPLPLALLHIGGVPLVEYSNGWWKALAAVATLPLTLWGPLLLAVTYAYYTRRRVE